MTPLFLLALKAIFPVAGKKPFADVTVNGLSNTVQWILALLVVLALIYFIYDRVVALGWRQSLRVVTVTLLGILALFTVAISYRFAFINYDYATEPMVYAHATPDIKLAMAQIEEISRKTTGDHSLKVAYDDDSTWPLEWYLRDYPKKAYFGASPSREAVDAPVVIAGDKNISKVKPYLGDRYYEFPYRLIWWPRETYKGLSVKRLQEILSDPKQRGQIWDMLIHRRYTTPTSQWDPVHRFSMFVRKDVASQVWDWGAPAAVAAAAAEAKDPYTSRIVPAQQQIGTSGTAGKAPGQFNFPRRSLWMARGKIYVADSGNNRIQVFNPDGSFLRQWGSTCKLDTKEGCQGDGRGPVQRAVGHRRGSGRQRLRLRHLESPHPEVRQRRQVCQHVGRVRVHRRRVGQAVRVLRPTAVGGGQGRQALCHGHRQQARAGVQSRWFLRQSVRRRRRGRGPFR